MCLQVFEKTGFWITENKKTKRTEFVRLSSDMEEMINLNSPFEKVSIYDEKGNTVEI